MASERSYQRVLQGIEDELRAGRVAPSGKLAGERSLATQHSVSRASVREALRVLEAMGMVRSATGSGPNAGATVTGDLSAPIGSALRWHRSSGQLPIDDVVEAAVLLETWSAATASGRADPSTFDAAGELLDRMSADLPIGDWLAMDRQFHAALAAAAGNAVVSAVLAALHQSLEPDLAATWATDRKRAAVVARLSAEHREILDAMVDEDADAAADLVASHVVSTYRALTD